MNTDLIINFTLSVQVGKRRAYNVGRMLRRRYGSFLDTTYYADVLEAVSTDKSRTKMSLQLVLAGLWPPNFEQMWNWQLSWQPIPYNYVPLLSDRVRKSKGEAEERRLYYQIEYNWL